MRVIIPAGFRGAQPMPKPGWTLTLDKARLEKPYESHGRPVTEDVSGIVWTAASKEAWLPDGHYEEFIFRGGLGPVAGPMWFKVVQTCSQGSNQWVEIPASGSSTKGLNAPAALLDVIGSGTAAHQH